MGRTEEGGSDGVPSPSYCCPLSRFSCIFCSTYPTSSFSSEERCCGASNIFTGANGLGCEVYVDWEIKGGVCFCA